MRDRNVLLRYLRFLRPDARADADDEIAFHLQMREGDLVKRGLPPGEARARATSEFGDVGRIREQVVAIDERRQRTSGRREWRADLWQDLRLAFRSLRRSPGFAAMAVTCVALGVGVTTTIFAAVNGMLLRPLPFDEPDRLVAVYGRQAERGLYGSNISYPDYLSWRDDSRVFSALGIWTWGTLALGGDGDEPERVETAEVSANLFPLLGVRPLVGRTFTAEEERRGGDHVLLLGHDLWQRRYASDPAIVGRSVQVDGVPYTVVGVMPPRFRFPERGQAWVPFSRDVSQDDRGNRMFAGAIGRLRPGVTLEQAQGDLDRVSSALAAQYPKDNLGWDAEVSSLRDDLVGALRRPLLVFLGAVAFVLLIACANVANLMLARGAGRQQEIAVRVALGAGRGRIVRQVLTESLAIAALGGLLGGVLVAYGVRLVGLAFPNGAPYYVSLGLDGWVIGFAVAVTAVTGLLFGLAPALGAARGDVQQTLREGSRGGTGGAERRRVRSALVLAEVALSVILLVGASLLIRSYRSLTTTDLGFSENGVLSARISLPTSRYTTWESRRDFFERLYARLAAIPGVEAVASAQGIPFSGWNVQAEMSVEGRPLPPRGQEFISLYQDVSPDWFRAIGVPLRRGRAFTAADRDSSLRIGIVNESFVRAQFPPNEDPLGKRFKFGSADETHEWYTIVGVVADYRHYRLPKPMGPAVYFPFLSMGDATQSLVLRTALADPHALIPPVREAVRALDPSLPLYDVFTFAEAVDRSLWRERFQGQVLSVFVALAIVLASVGIYGVVAWNVAQRTRELGVRMALGATRARVLGLVLSEAARLALLGVAIGVAGAFAVSRVLGSLLHGVKATDPLTYVTVPLVLTAVALTASYVPARRASAVDPSVAMRAD